LGGAAFLEQQMDSISSQIPYSITPAQYIQYKDGLKKVRMQAGGGIEARHEAGSGCHRCPVSERK